VVGKPLAEIGTNAIIGTKKRAQPITEETTTKKKGKKEKEKEKEKEKGKEKDETKPEGNVNFQL
jgi:hypothetical protein